jgi:hemerythrin-like metal-binding protein
VDPKYIIGVPEMDEQHARLLALAERARSIGDDDFDMNTVILDLINYAKSHLDEEEAFLVKNGLSDFQKDHAKKHLLFRNKAMEFYGAFRELTDTEAKSKLLKEIVNFCETWLLQHINVEDRVYAELLRQRKTS